jgi:hypothetical protein
MADMADLADHDVEVDRSFGEIGEPNYGQVLGQVSLPADIPDGQAVGGDQRVASIRGPLLDLSEIAHWIAPPAANMRLAKPTIEQREMLVGIEVC